MWFAARRDPSRQGHRWRDFWLPSDPDVATNVLRLAHQRGHSDRVEIACGGGVGRTGTALAVMCIFDGMEPDAAVGWVREHYHSRAVEVPWQRRYLGSVWAAGSYSTHSPPGVGRQYRADWERL